MCGLETNRDPSLTWMSVLGMTQPQHLLLCVSGPDVDASYSTFASVYVN